MSTKDGRIIGDDLSSEDFHPVDDDRLSRAGSAGVDIWYQQNTIFIAVPFL